MVSERGGAIESMTVAACDGVDRRLGVFEKALESCAATDRGL